MTVQVQPQGHIFCSRVHEDVGVKDAVAGKVIGLKRLKVMTQVSAVAFVRGHYDHHQSVLKI